MFIARRERTAAVPQREQIDDAIILFEFRAHLPINAQTRNAAVRVDIEPQVSPFIRVAHLDEMMPVACEVGLRDDPGPA